MDELMISSVAMNYPVYLILCGFLFSLIYSYFREDEESNIASKIFGLLRFVGYGLLALFIYIKTANVDKVDILVYFTYVLAVFEGGHNFAEFGSGFIVSIIKLIFKKE